MRVFEHPHFLTGLRVGGAVSTVLLLLAYICVLPTNEFRARLSFLLSHPRDYTLHLLLGGLLVLAGSLTLLFAGRFKLLAFAGVLFESVVSVGLVSSGLFDRLPEFHSVEQRVIAAVVLLAAAVIAVFLTRATNSSSAKL